MCKKLELDHDFGEAILLHRRLSRTKLPASQRFERAIFTDLKEDLAMTVLRIAVLISLLALTASAQQALVPPASCPVTLTAPMPYLPPPLGDHRRIQGREVELRCLGGTYQERQTMTSWARTDSMARGATLIKEMCECNKNERNRQNVDSMLRDLREITPAQ